MAYFGRPEFGGGDRIDARLAAARVVVLAVIAAFPLAALQLLPTARLAGLAASQRDFEYLSGFAATPFHLVNCVAPGLFHRSPLWRPLVWDPFHTSPEELLGYVGLVPLFLAWAATVREFRRDAAVRFLAVMSLVGLILSLGPYAPGFHYLIKVPGFSYFRAPARWGLMTALALAILAGKGFDRWQAWPRIGRSLVWFVTIATVWVLLVLGVMELALVLHGQAGLARHHPRVPAGLSGRCPGLVIPASQTVMAVARQSQPDPRLPIGASPSGRAAEAAGRHGSSPASAAGSMAGNWAKRPLLLMVLWWLGWKCGTGWALGTGRQAGIDRHHLARFVRLGPAPAA